MMCEHEFETYKKRVEYLERTFIKSELASMLVDAQQQFAAANARVAELEKDNARQKRLATISRLCKNVQACRAEKAEAQCAAMQSVLTAAREYDTICTQIHAMTEPIPGYMLDVASKSRQALHDALAALEPHRE